MPIDWCNKINYRHKFNYNLHKKLNWFFQNIFNYKMPAMVTGLHLISRQM